MILHDPLRSEVEKVDSYCDGLALCGQFLFFLDFLPVKIAIIDEHGKISMLNDYMVQFLSNFLSEQELHDSADSTLHNLFLKFVDDYDSIDTIAQFRDAFSYIDVGEADKSFKILNFTIDNVGKTFAVSKQVVNFGTKQFNLILVNDISNIIGLRSYQGNELIQYIRDLKTTNILIAGVLHNINNLLTAIMVHIESAILKLSAPVYDVEQILGLLNRIRNQIARSSEFIRNVQTVKIDRRVRYKKCFDIVEVIKKVTELFNTMYRSVDVILDDSMVDSRYFCIIDRYEFEQLFLNLFINAKEAEGRNIYLTINQEDLPAEKVAPFGLPDGSYIHIRVRDDGEGIPQHLLERIFEPYFTTKPKGTGLGLVTVLDTIKEHEGIIEVESQVGVGTTFHIFLPTVKTCRVKEDSAKGGVEKGKEMKT